jgi:peptide/nickel transport system permease protein
MRRLPWVPLALPGLVAVVVALAGPYAVADSSLTSRGRPFLPPQAGLPLGSDHLGRDVWSVLLASGATLVWLPLLATALGTLLGGGLGLITGWYRGRLSGLALRAAELLLVVPPLLVTVLALNAATDAGLAVLVCVVALLGVPSAMRFSRSATMAVSSRGYLDHAVALGEPTSALLVREVLPTIAAPVLADAGLRLVGAIYVVASVSFLGLGGAALDSSWASMVAANIAGVALNPWALVAPAVCIVAFAVSVNLVADRFADLLRGSIR